MSSKTRPPLTLTDEQMIERIRDAQAEDRNGTLTHITNEEELRAFFASLRSPEA
jgi:tRNA isopentenyl-2-thiomethyl-A-37 hydroxylase MiaE